MKQYIFNNSIESVKRLISYGENGEVNKSLLLYLINYSGLDDNYMERSKITISNLSLEFLWLYHKTFNKLPELPQIQGEIYSEYLPALVWAQEVTGKNVKKITMSALSQITIDLFAENAKILRDLTEVLEIEFSDDCSFDIGKIITYNSEDIPMSSLGFGV